VGHSLVNDGNANALCQKAPHPPLPAGTTATIDCKGRMGRYVNIRSPGTARTMTMCEVNVTGLEASGTPPPLLLFKPASQKCHAAATSDESHRIVQLPVLSQVDHAIVRTDPTGAPQIITVGAQTSSAPNVQAIQCGDPEMVAAGGSQLMECSSSVVGRFVKISAHGWNQTLSTCDLEVWGYPRPPVLKNVVTSDAS
jgi:hypothetical protein